MSTFKEYVECCLESAQDSYKYSRYRVSNQTPGLIAHSQPMRRESKRLVLDLRFILKNLATVEYYWTSGHKLFPKSFVLGRYEDEVLENKRAYEWYRKVSAAPTDINLKFQQQSLRRIHQYNRLIQTVDLQGILVECYFNIRGWRINGYQ